MRRAVMGLVVVLALVAVVAIAWSVSRAKPTQAPPASQPVYPAVIPLRLGLIPERDIFEQRKRYEALAEYVSAKLGRPVNLVTARSYQGILEDLAEDRVDAAFLGSLVSVLAMDRLGARVLVKPELPDAGTTYQGVIFVPEGSPIRSVEDLGGRTMAVVRTTTAGHLYPMYALWQSGLLTSEKRPRFIWIGTHDEAIRAVLEGRADAGAVKSHRLSAFERANPAQKLRHVATSASVPENALIIRRDMAEQLAGELGPLLMAMNQDPAGREALAQFGATRFVSCSPEEYQAIYDMVDDLTEVWDQVGVDGPPPRRPSTQPATKPVGATAK
jgi:phosphonate transport system substrate-binding protein